MVDEWALELGDELDLSDRNPANVLPLVPGPNAISALLEAPALSAETRFGLQMLYATGVRPLELPRLRRGERLEVEGDRPLAVDPKTLSAFTGPLPHLIEDEFLAAAEATGLAQRFRSCGRNLRPQMLRHAFAIRCLQDGMDVIAVSRLMGHQDLRTTENYIAAAMASSQVPYRRYHPLLNPAPTRGGTVQANITEREAAAIIESPASARDRLLLRVLYSAGLRASESLGLVPGDLDREQNLLFIRNGKEDKDRYALLDPQSMEQLAGYTEQRIFATTRQQIFVILKRAAKKLGLLEKYRGFSLSPHSLRHAFASHLFARGMASDDIRKLLGHDYLRTTFLYIDCPDELSR